MPAAYNSQSASGDATVNPVVAQELGNPTPLPAPNCCSYFHLIVRNFANSVKQLQ